MLAESIVTFGPIAQLGWASASADGRRADPLRAPFAKRAAGSGQDHFDDLVGIAAAHRLKNGVVFGIERQDARAGARAPPP